ncbi:Aspartate dehydrogenase domain-containing protein [Aphelenchoides bicaudatus]|nr:Aspartate dehydrogenase domain-containing protein [Aphelenchoides bicaudatus]
MGESKTRKRRVGIIGNGHLGQFLRHELTKSDQFTVEKIWNRSEDERENVLPLTELNEENLKDIDLVIEVAHPQVVENFAALILKHADFFIGSPTALANKQLYDTIQGLLKTHNERAVYIPSGAFWGASDVKKMADLKTLSSMQITMIKHPSSFKVKPPLDNLCKQALSGNAPVVLYEGPVRTLCSLAPNNVNRIQVFLSKDKFLGQHNGRSGNWLLLHNLGFDKTMAKLIADPAIKDWHIVEYEIKGDNGFYIKLRRENPAKQGAITGSVTYFSFLSSVIETLHKPPGFNLC